MLDAFVTFAAPALAGLSAACAVKAAFVAVAARDRWPRLPSPGAPRVRLDCAPADPRDAGERAAKLFCVGARR